MAIGKTLGDVRPQAGDILVFRVNQRPHGEHEVEAEVQAVVEGKGIQQLHAVCKVANNRRLMSFGQGTEVVKSLW